MFVFGGGGHNKWGVMLALRRYIGKLWLPKGDEEKGATSFLAGVGGLEPWYEDFFAGQRI